MSHAYKEHSTRLSINAEINPSKIGNYNFKSEIFKHAAHADETIGKNNYGHSSQSHQIQAYIKRVSKKVNIGPALIETGHYYVGVCSDAIAVARSDEKPLDIEVTNSLSGTYFRATGTTIGNNTSTIKISSSAGYPFAEPFSPNIDFELEIELYKNLVNKSINIQVKGWHNDFPAYELVIGHKVVYSHNPSDYGYTGPGFGNLWKSRDFNVSESVLLTDWQIKNLNQKSSYGWLKKY